MRINDVTMMDRDGTIAIVTVASPPVNALSAMVRGAMADALRAAFADADIAAIVIVCASRTFSRAPT